MEPLIEPIPSEALPEDKRFNKLPHHDVLFKPPFTMAVLGAIASGKSSFTYSLIHQHYKKYFDEVVVVCGTLDSKQSWEGMNQRKVVFLDAFDESAFSAYIKQLEEDQAERKAKGKFPIRVLMILDDCVFDNFHKNRGVLENLFMTCRHYFISIILCLQHSKQITPAIRNQIMYYVLHRLTANDLKKVADEHSNLLSSDEFIKMYNDIHKQGKHEFLIVNYKKPMNERFSHRFTKIISIADYK